MARQQPPRRERRRTQPTTNGPLPPTGNADPRSHITRAETTFDLNTEDDRYAGTFGIDEWIDTDLDRRLLRRGWERTGVSPGCAWTYPPSIRTTETAPEPKVDPMVDAAIDAHLSGQVDWMEQARALPAELTKAEVIARIGSRPDAPQIVTDWMKAGPPYDNAGPTSVAVGDDGASYDVSRPGFDGDAENVVYTNRQELLGDLTEIEAWRFVGPAWRWRAGRKPT